MKIVVSWLAAANDVYRNAQEGLYEVKVGSPNVDLHRNFYHHQCHYLLHDGKLDSVHKVGKLTQAIRAEFPSHQIETADLDIQDPIDIHEVYSKVSDWIEKFRGYEVDLFFSPGTSIMQLSWVLCHLHKGMTTRLIQGRPPDKLKKGEPQFSELKLQESWFVRGLELKQYWTNKEKQDAIYLSETLKPIYELAEQLAQIGNLNVLIRGESGSGKEPLAQFLHRQSPRSGKTFLAVNCGAFPDQLLAAELFGTSKNAYTGAVDRLGVFESADGGTLFLDEIGDISPSMQVALLRVLQLGEFQRLGESKTRKANVRILAATHQGLEEACRAGRFRWDLYYRLRVAELKLPALRDYQPTELKGLFEYFLTSASIKFQIPAVVLNEDAAKIIASYSWPGNYREMENLAQMLTVYYSGKHLTNALLLPWINEPLRNDLEILPLDDAIREHLLKSRQKFKGSQADLCKKLGISQNTFKKYISEKQ